jgi:glycosyltransferase involved in cell wall biosynthesis
MIDKELSMNINMPLVSIIIPTYNRAYLIGETLDSVLAQTYINWECIVVDDDSTDHTDKLLYEYCNKDSRFQYHKRPKDRSKGANACRNYGFELSKGEYVNWFDSDDLMDLDFIEFKINNIQNKCILVTSGYIINDKKEIKRGLRFDGSFNLYTQLALEKTEILTNTVMFKKNFLVGKKLFDCKITRGQEAEFFLRTFFGLSESKYRIINYKNYFYREHTETKSFKALSYVKSYRKSQAYIYSQNLIVSINIKDFELFKFYYIHLIRLILDAAENRDFFIHKYVLNIFFKTIFKKNKFTYCSIVLLSSFLFVIKRKSYIIGKKMRNFQIKI